MSGTVHLYPADDGGEHVDNMQCDCVPHVDLYEDPQTKQYQWIIRHSRMRRVNAA